MPIEVGAKVKGKISGITKFGAFVDLENKKTGLVHISEVSDNFVKDINDILNVGDEVSVKILSIGDNGKIALSIRKANPTTPKQHVTKVVKNNGSQKFNRNSKSTQNGNQSMKQKDFDSLLAGFLKESEDRLTSLKRNTEGKRGGRGGRRN